MKLVQAGFLLVIVLVGCSRKAPAHDDRDAILSKSIAEARRSGDAAVEATARFVAQNGTHGTVLMPTASGGSCSDSLHRYAWPARKDGVCWELDADQGGRVDNPTLHATVPDVLAKINEVGRICEEYQFDAAIGSIDGVLGNIEGRSDGDVLTFGELRAWMKSYKADVEKLKARQMRSHGHDH